jgi:hypothetical protein
MNKVIDIISLFSPFILVSVYVFMSIFYQDLKAVILLSGIFFTIYILKQVTDGNFNNDDNNFIIYCSMFNTLETPGTSTAVISFMFMYMLLPMIYNNEYNALVLTTISLLWILDIYHKLFQYACFDKSIAIIATLIGLSCSSGYFFTIYNLGEEYYNFLYFNVSKNNLVQCSKNNETEYVCEYEDDTGTANGLQDLSVYDGTIQQGDNDVHVDNTAIVSVKQELETINKQINNLLVRDYATDSQERDRGGIHYHYSTDEATTDPLTSEGDKDPYTDNLQ